MEYISKIWLQKPTALNEIAYILGLDEITLFSTEDIVGTIKYKDKTILVLIHLSWGEIDRVQKIKVYTQYVADEDTDELDNIFVNRLRDAKLLIDT